MMPRAQETPTMMRTSNDNAKHFAMVETPKHFAVALGAACDPDSVDDEITKTCVLLQDLNQHVPIKIHFVDVFFPNNLSPTNVASVELTMSRLLLNLQY